MLNRYLSILLIWSILFGYANAAELIIYSGRSDKFVKPVAKAFTAKTGIDVVLHAGSSTALLNKLKLEGQRTAADIYISNDAGNLQKGSELGLFKPLAEDLLAVIPKKMRAEDNTWVGLSARARVLVVNKNDPTGHFAKSVFDLADKRLAGKLAITHSSNESYIAGATVYMRMKGKQALQQWLQGMKQNVQGSVFNKHSKIVKAVAEGRKSIGLVNHYYILRHLDKHPNAPIELVVPDQDKGIGVAWNVAGAAVTAHARHVQEAQQFMAFVVSEQGQKIFAEVNREYPTRKGVAIAKKLPPLTQMKVADVPMKDLGTYRSATLDIIEAVGMP